MSNPIPFSCVASDSSGQNLYACSNDSSGCIYRSADSGITWTKTSAPQAKWSSICCDNNGNVYACITDGGIWVGRSNGNAWSKTLAKDAKWSCINYNSQTPRLYACATNDTIWYTTDLSGNWTKTSAPVRTWTSICINFAGNILYACSNEANGAIFRSTNNGSSWSSVNVPAVAWTSICCDDAGVDAYACSSNGFVFRSIDANAANSTWSQVYVPSQPWRSICCDRNGAIVNVCSSLNNGFFRSTNANATTSTNANANTTSTWGSNGLPPPNTTSITCDRNRGDQLVAVNSNGEIWINNRVSGGGWKQLIYPSTTFESGSLIAQFSFLDQQIESDTLIPGTLDPSMVSTGQIASVAIPLLFIKLKSYAFGRNTMLKNVSQNLGKFLFMTALQNSTNDKINDLVQQYFPEQAETIIPKIQSAISTFFEENIKSIQESRSELDVSQFSSENAEVLKTIQQEIQKEIQENLALLTK